MRWGAMPMEGQVNDRMRYQVARRQTTFWDFTDSEGTTRVHFIAKKEFGFTQPAVASFSIEADHPLLADYSNGWVQIFVSAPVIEPGLLVAKIDEAVKEMSKHWRTLATYREPDVTLDVLGSGYGALGGFPMPMATAIAAILIREGIRHTVLPSFGPRGKFQVLIAGKNWVVAESFRIEELPLD